MSNKILNNVDDMLDYFGLEKKPIEIVENDLAEVLYKFDSNRRKFLDCEVLSHIAASVPAGKMLDIGTYEGRSALRMAVNSPESKIYTVNIHPDKIQDAGKLVTGVPAEIGSMFKGKDYKIEQIYADTRTWNMPKEITDLSLAYIDGCHDSDCVYSDTMKAAARMIIPGGFILWHDCTPIYRKEYDWIDSVMTAVDKLISEGIVKEVINVKNSWIGIWRLA